MISSPGTRPGAASGVGARSTRLVLGLAALTLLGACAGRGPSLSWPSFGRGATQAQPASPASLPVPAGDPVLAFAATAQPGAADRITLPGGQPASIRLVRAYHSANGRECREVLVAAGMAERSRIVCAGETGWVEARPLMRGGATGRP